MIFVLGTGRSGTHWIAWILEDHPEIETLIEKPPIFNWVVEMALNKSSEEVLFPRLVSRYRAERSLAGRLYLLDKSHPNIWVADLLQKELPKARFLGVRRDVYGTVSSMLQHKGVRKWVEQWEEFPVPNRFLGVTEENKDRYREMSLAGRCALRWLAHERRLDRLEQELGERMYQVDYLRLHNETDVVLDELKDFLGLSCPIKRPSIKQGSLDKWRSLLTDSDVHDIDHVLASE
ncbi:sulfotransferase [Thioalkalivibrio sp. AKL10]|uniref:sulfotransferase family protein n=1 Tax=Thioalkalivibrio sp. AKL10 TaxID=1158158 RepID=UPI00036C8612|nr:sulfotransferase [Thioalkalivibrio sp. AKL10]